MPAHTATNLQRYSTVKPCACAALATCSPTRHPLTAAMPVVLVEQLLKEAARDGADMALLFVTPGQTSYAPDGFEAIPMLDVELRVTESSRHGAPMTLVRGGEDRDLAAIVAMGQARSDQFRFHLDRDADFVKHEITKKRLLGGLTPSGTRELQFVIGEEGINGRRARRHQHRWRHVDARRMWRSGSFGCACRRTPPGVDRA